MHAFKSDRRYKYFNQGLHYIAEFRWHNREDKLLFTSLVKELTAMYGLSHEKVTTKNGVWMPHWQFNENWRYEQNVSAKRRRLYFKTEADLSMILLKVPNGS